MANSTGSSVDQIWDAYKQYKTHEKTINGIKDPEFRKKTREDFKEAFSDRIDFILKNNPPTPEEFDELSSRIASENELKEILLRTKFDDEKREEAISQSLEDLVSRESLKRRNLDGEHVRGNEFCIRFPGEELIYKCFIPLQEVEQDERTREHKIKPFPRLKDITYSNKEVAQLFEHIKQYMKNKGIEIDPNIIDYEEELRPGKHGYLYGFEALKYFLKMVRGSTPLDIYNDWSFYIRDGNSDSYICVHAQSVGEQSGSYDISSSNLGKHRPIIMK